MTSDHTIQSSGSDLLYEKKQKRGAGQLKNPGRIVFLTPVPPMKSGTADFGLAFLQGLQPLLQGLSVTVAADMRFLEGAEVPPIHDFAVIDYQDYLPEATDTVFVSVGNNPFHSFCLHFLRRPKVVHKIISVLHDAQIFMHVDALCRIQGYGFNEDCLLDMMTDEFSHCASVFCDVWRGGRLPNLFYYTTAAQAMVTRHSSSIWVHSHYAAAKLLLEHASPEALPPIRVIHLPGGEHLRPFDQKRSRPVTKEFMVGVFGWVHPMKRVNEIIQAFSSWLRSLPGEEQSKVHLAVVGELPDSGFYDPVSVAEKVGVRDSVTFLGFTDLHTFEELLQQCSLIFNLRFPSVGETSGTLQRARDLGVPVAVSAYAAFHEEPADYKCSILPEEEQQDIMAVLNECWQVWRAFGSTQTLSKSNPFACSKTDFRDAFIAEFA
ncbi:MAG TPA: hypothetical protein DEO88_14335 [Syntrophobacteraceae bacterium]|nr:hypothetical protein [Syntrophobacteraceae bacterium]